MALLRKSEIWNLESEIAVARLDRAGRTLNVPRSISGKGPMADLDLMQGTLDVLVLKALAWGPRHGYGIARWLRDTTDDTILVEDRALYLALHRLEERGLIDAEWGLSENNRKARYYSLTRAGKRELTQRQESWTVYADAVFKVLRATRADA